MSDDQKTFWIDAAKSLGFPVIVAGFLLYVIHGFGAEYIAATVENDQARTAAMIDALNKRSGDDDVRNDALVEAVELTKQELELTRSFLDRFIDLLDQRAASHEVPYYPPRPVPTGPTAPE